jgi:protein-L-isoaspartate O-methyltransferase
MAEKVSGTEGYADEAEVLLARYESLSAADVHRAVLHLLPTRPARVLDIGSGTGRDAAWLASLGHEVVAVEPTDVMRSRATALHTSPSITWVDDSLPDLALLRTRAQRFDLVMLTAVFMHLDRDQRVRAMPNIVSQLVPNGRLIMRLRHGPVPPGRRMFEVTPDEVIALAASDGLTAVFNHHGEASGAQNRSDGVTWTTLAFARPG